MDPNAKYVELGDMQDAAQDTNNFFIGKNLEGGKSTIDLTGVKDLYDDDAIFEEMKAEGNIFLEEDPVKKERVEGEPRQKKEKTKSQKEIKRIEEESFAKEY